MIKKHKSHHSGKVSLRRKRSQRISQRKSQRKKSQRKKSQRKKSQHKRQRQRTDGMKDSKKEIPKGFEDLAAKLNEVKAEKNEILKKYPDRIHDVEAFMEDELCEYLIIGIKTIKKDEYDNEVEKTILINTMKENEIDKMSEEMKKTLVHPRRSGRSDEFGDYLKTMAPHDGIFEFIDTNY
jgi:hypothetical protein